MTISAIAREKQIKGWTRAKKIALIDSQNPEWRDLSAEWFGEWQCGCHVERSISKILHYVQNDNYLICHAEATKHLENASLSSEWQWGCHAEAMTMRLSCWGNEASRSFFSAFRMTMRLSQWHLGCHNDNEALAERSISESHLEAQQLCLTL